MVRHQWFKVHVILMVLSALFLIMAAACGTVATPNPTVTLPPPVATPLAAAPTEQGVTREGVGRGAGNVKETIQIEAGQTDLRVGKTTLAPGGYLSWHYHDGPALFSVLSGTVTMKHADGATEDYPAGSAFYELAGQGDLHRYDNNGNEDAVVLVTVAIPGGPPDQAPSMMYVPDPTTTDPLSTQPDEQGVTREGVGRGAGNVKETIQIEAGQTDLRVGKTTLAPGGYLSWHYHDGPALFSVLSGTVTMKHADGATEDYPAGSAFFELAGQGDLHRYDNNGNEDAVVLVTVAIPGGPPDQAPSMMYVPDPTTR